MFNGKGLKGLGYSVAGLFALSSTSGFGAFATCEEGECKAATIGSEETTATNSNVNNADVDRVMNLLNIKGVKEGQVDVIDHIMNLVDLKVNRAQCVTLKEVVDLYKIMKVKNKEFNDEIERLWTAIIVGFVLFGGIAVLGACMLYEFDSEILELQKRLEKGSEKVEVRNSTSSDDIDLNESLF